ARHAARGLDALQDAPALAGELVAHRLEVPRAAERVVDARQLALVAQHGDGVAGDPPAEVARDPEGGVERERGDDVGFAEDRGEALRRAPQDVRVRIAPGQRPGRGDGVDRRDQVVHAAGGEHVVDDGPQRPELRDLEEDVAAYGDTQEEALREWPRGDP